MLLSALKILMITPFQHQQRGNSITCSRLQKGLASRGYNIDLLALEDCDPLTRMELQDYSRYALVHGFHGRHLARAFEKNPGLADLPLVLTTTGTDINIDMYNDDKVHLERIFLAANKIVVFHRDFADTIGGLYPELKPKLAVIPQGICLPVSSPPLSRKQLSLKETDFIFLLPSGLRPVKNIALALDALEKLQSHYPHLRLLIIGSVLDPDYSKAILQRISRLSWVQYLGEIPHEQVGSWMQLADVVVNTSRAEGQPQAVLEAMSLGKPGILTAVPGNLGIIKSGREGYYVQDEDELLQAAQFLINNPAMTKKMGLAARRLVEENYRLEQELDSYEDLYKELLG